MTKRRTILILENEPDQRHLLAEVFRREGFHVVMADSNATARLAIEIARPDALVADKYLGDGPATEMIRSLDAGLRPVFTMLLSAAPEPDDRPVFDVVRTKPLLPDHLVAIVIAELAAREGTTAR